MKWELITVMMIFLRYGTALVHKRYTVTPFGRCLSAVPALDDFQTQLQRYKPVLAHLNDKQMKQILTFCKHIEEWNVRVNLVSRKDVDNLVERHVMPSLAVGLAYPFRAEESVVDVGTGGGFPGIPLAIAFPSTRFTLMDSVAKKTEAVSSMVRSLGLHNVAVVTCRAEKYTGTHDFITGRSVTRIPEFIAQTGHMLTRKQIGIRGGILYIKGGDFTDELEPLDLQNCRKERVSDLVPGLDSDKMVLHIPVKDVVACRNKAKRWTPAAVATTQAASKSITDRKLNS